MSHRTGVLLMLLASILSPASTRGADFRGCGSCHGASLGAAQARTHLHPPFALQQCEVCHTAPEPAPSPSASEDRGKIRWLGESVAAYTRHGFVVPDDEIGGQLVAEVQGDGGAFSRQVISVPPLSDLPEAEDAGRPPVVSEVQVVEVRRGLFLSATIGWRTDTLADASVRYGEEDLSQVCEPGDRVGRRHEVVLNSLRPDTTYRFCVVSCDLFGRCERSAPSTFSTSSPATATRPDEPVAVSETAGQTGLVCSFRRLGDDYLLELTLAQPATLSIGTRDLPRGQVPGDAFHTDLSSGFAASIKACLGCHPGHLKAAHPVNVYPKEGMTIPPEYPTLADGRITCVSCHDSHGSMHERLARRPFKTELCVGCHRRAG